MKKEYISPETLLMDIRLQQMITVSGDPKSTLNDDDADPEGEVLGRRRRRNAWDEDEEEDW